MYQKEIIYLSLYDNDVKEGCVGYLKSEERQEKFRLELQIKNIPGALSGNCPISLLDTTGWHETGIFMLKEGSGRWAGSVDEPVMRVEIVLPDSNKIKGQSRNAPKQEERAGEHSGLSKSEETEWNGRGMSESGEIESGERIRPESANSEFSRQVTLAHEDHETKQNDAAALEGSESGQQDMVRTPDNVPERGTNTGSLGNGIRQRGNAESLKHEQGRQAESKSYIYKPEQRTVAESAERRAELQIAAEPAEIRQAFTGIRNGRYVRPESAVTTENIPLYESKWEQLLATYEQIHPYGDSRVYVKLEPKDFVILPSGYQHLVNNSFLLHGFYNYRYLILGKEKDFYLGVPGVFYEREKMVALMFGFEAFECEGGNAEEGKFGYYLRKVEL